MALVACQPSNVCEMDSGDMFSISSSSIPIDSKIKLLADSDLVIFQNTVHNNGVSTNDCIQRRMNLDNEILFFI